MNEVGINLRVTEDASSVVPRAVESLGRVRESMRSVLEETQKGTDAFREWSEQLRAVHTAQATGQATRPLPQGTLLDASGRPISGPMAGGAFNQQGTAVLDLKRSLDDLVDIMSDMVGQIEKSERVPPRPVQEEEGGTPRKRRNKIAPNEGEPTPEAEDGGLSIKSYRRARGVGGALTNLASGNVVGSAISGGSALLDTIAEGWAGLSGLAKGGLIGGVAALGIAAGGNALSKQYEDKMGSAMDLVGLMGRYGPGNNSLTIRRTMRDVSDSAAAEGFTYDQGAAATTAMLRAGSRLSSVSADRDQVMRYARALGLGPQDLAQFKGIEAKTGNSNLLGLAMGGAEVSGIGQPRALEYLEAMTSILEDGFSKGIKIDATETSKALNWLSGGGAAWSGASGGAMWSQMRGATERATGLNSQNDVVMFRAARKMAGSDLEAMKLLENPNSELMKGVWGEIKGMTGGNKEDAIRMIRSTFGTNFTQSESLYGLFSDGSMDKAAAVVKASGETGSREKSFLSDTEQFQQNLRQFGGVFTDIKGETLKVARIASDGLLTVTGLDLKTDAERDAINAAADAARLSKTVGRGSDEIQARIGQGDAELLAEVRGKNPKSFDALTRIANGLPSPEMVLTQEEAGMIPKGSKDSLFALQNLLSGKGNRYADLLNSPIGDSPTVTEILKGGIKGSEVAPLLSALTKALEDNTKATAAASGSTSEVKVMTPFNPLDRPQAGQTTWGKKP